MSAVTIIVEPDAIEDMQALIQSGAICIVGREIELRTAQLRDDGIWEYDRPANGGAPTKPILAVSPDSAPSQIFHGIEQAAQVMGCSKKAISDALESEKPVSRGSAKGWHFIRQTRRTAK